MFLVLVSVATILTATSAQTTPAVDPNAELRRAFQQDIDTNSDGIGSVAEFTAYTLRFDGNKDGNVTRSEYLQATNGSASVTPVFNNYDTDNDGVWTNAEIQAAVMGFDSDGNGQVTENEFVNEYSAVIKRLFSGTDPNTARYHDAFLAVDANHDGKATLYEFQNLSAGIDTDHDGKISLQEYAVASHAPPNLVANFFNYLDFDNTSFIEDSDIARAVKMFDDDLDGHVTEVEYTRALSMIFTKLGVNTAGTDIAGAIHKAFTDVDSNHDGIATPAEFNARTNGFDSDTDGHLTLNEYAAGLGVQPNDIAPIFNYFDVDDNGQWDKTDFDSAIRAFDMNNDGSVTETEFALSYGAALRAIYGKN